MRLLPIAVLTFSLVASTTFAGSLHTAVHAAPPPGTHGLTQVIVEMQDAPAVQVYAALRGKDERLAQQSTRDAVRRIDGAQRQLIPTIAQLGGTILYRMQRVYQ